LGSIGPLEVGKMLQKERRGGSGISTTFALEVAFIMEHFGENSEDDAKLILELYLLGSKSVMLAASFAQRNLLHSELLWKILVDHCLLNVNPSKSFVSSSIDGSMYGLLLEAAAFCGADLAHLIAQIPPAMQVAGLKPLLVAAVSDYRLKVQMHNSSSKVASKDKLMLLREVTQRARKGMRYDPRRQTDFKHFPSNVSQPSKIRFMSPPSGHVLRPKSGSTCKHNERNALKTSLPIR
jgi:hypothetical protein